MNGLRKSLWNAMLILCMFSLFLTQSFANPLSTSVYLLLTGTVNKYGDDPAMGWLDVVAKDGGWAKTRVAFIIPRWWHIPEISPTGIHIYGFTLVNASTVSVQKSAAYIAGNWTGFHIFWNGTSIKSLAQAIKNIAWIKTNGNLSITDAYTVFTISLKGFEPITGTVVHTRIITTEDILEGDLNYDGKVDIRDIAQSAKAYGSLIGEIRYELQADFNFDFFVDIQDIARVCRNFGKSY